MNDNIPPYRGPTEDEVKLSIASWLRDYVNSGKESQADLAIRLDVSEATISNWMTGGHMPGFKAAVRLHFGVGAHLEKMMRFPHDEVARLHTTRHRRAQTNDAVKKVAK